jgi:hypothetical protein
MISMGRDILSLLFDPHHAQAEIKGGDELDRLIKTPPAVGPAPHPAIAQAAVVVVEVGQELGRFQIDACTGTPPNRDLVPALTVSAFLVCAVA